MKECQPVAICTFANGVWFLNVKWFERRKLTGCGNIDKAKGLCEMYEGAAAETDLKINMLNGYLTTIHIIVLPERTVRYIFFLFEAFSVCITLEKSHTMLHHFVSF